ncbi:MAG TPA: hypothetical protein VHL53_03330, partial [Acidimicrobiia bacterium]|nr:hypothetical protein [Acidimicrobiia bacterium]
GLALVAAVIAVPVAGLAVASSGGSARAPSAGRPAPPWRATVAAAAVPAPWVAAWERAANRTSCALLFPLDGGPELSGATAGEERTAGDRGWDITLAGPAGVIEVIGLFPRTTDVDAAPGTGPFTRRWADGSAARYAPDVANAAPGTYDPDTSPFEAVLTVPGQKCGYRIYDSLGRAHLEATFDRLRLIAR